MKDLIYLSNYHKEQKKHKTRKIAFWMMMLTLTGFISYEYLYIRGHWGIGIILLILMMGMSVAIHIVYRQFYQNAQLNQIAAESIERRDSQWKLSNTHNLTIEEIGEGYLITKPDFITTKNQVTGKVENSVIFQSRVELYKKKYMLGKREQLMIFSGTYSIIHLPFYFNGIHVIIGKNQFNLDETNYLKRVGDSKLKTQLGHRYHLFTDKAEEIESIFTDELIQLIHSIENRYQCEVRMSFKRNCIHLGINTMKVGKKVDYITEREYNNLEFDIEMFKKLCKALSVKNQIQTTDQEFAFYK